MEQFITIMGYIIIAPFVIGSAFWLGYFLLGGIMLGFESLIEKMKSNNE